MLLQNLFMTAWFWSGQDQSLQCPELGVARTWNVILNLMSLQVSGERSLLQQGLFPSGGRGRGSAQGMLILSILRVIHSPLSCTLVINVVAVTVPFLISLPSPVNCF